MSEGVVDRGEIEEMMWALADIRIDVAVIRRYLLEDDDEEEEEEEPEDDA